MSDNNLPEINTVSDLIRYLQTLPQDLLILKGDWGEGAGRGYNRFIITDEIIFPVVANTDPKLRVEFVDHNGISFAFGGNAPQLTMAVVL